MVNKVAEFSHADRISLLSCNKNWSNSCNQHKLSAHVQAETLKNSVQLLSGFFGLERLHVTSKAFPSAVCCIPDQALSLLHERPLKVLSLTSGCLAHQHSQLQTSDESKSMEENIEEGSSTMLLENLGMLLQPWYQSLEHIQIDHCQPLSNNSSTQSVSLSFADIPHLHTLQLVSSHASVNNILAQTFLNLSKCTALHFLDCCGSGIFNLNLSGCSALETLFCQHNEMKVLSLYGCSALTSIDCNHNQLTVLDLTASANVKHLECSYNILARIELPLSAILDTLICAGRSQHTLILGCSGVAHLECTAQTFSMSSPMLRKGVLQFILSDSSAPWILHGFQDLKFLSCGSNQASHGMLDLTGCSEIRLQCVNEPFLFHNWGGRNVHQLTLTQQGILQPMLHQFSELRELYMTLHCGGSLGLSVCKMLQKVHLIKTLGEVCLLTSVSLAGCLFLEQLTCNHFGKLSKLDLTRCVALKNVMCTNSSLTFVDVSWSSRFENLNISGSVLVMWIKLSSCNALLEITYKDGGLFSDDEGPLCLAPRTLQEKALWHKFYKKDWHVFAVDFHCIALELLCDFTIVKICAMAYLRIWFDSKSLAYISWQYKHVHANNVFRLNR